MDIRRLHMADASEYRALRLRGLREHPDAFTSSFEEENLRPLAYTQARLGIPKTEKIWGAFVNGVLAGMVGLSHETRVKNRHKAALVSLYVAGEFTGQGLGCALVDTVLQDAQTCGVELVVLTVTDGNQAACALYEKAGFLAFGIEPDAIRVNGISFGKQHLFIQLPAP